MKLILYSIILAVVLLAPVNRQDIGDLEPIQAIWLTQHEDSIVLKTDTGDHGAGVTVEEAVESMRKNSEGVVYLDTAQFLLISENAVPHMDRLISYLRQSVKLCLWEGENVSAAASYMQSHDMGSKIKEVQAGKQLQKIPELSEKERNQGKKTDTKSR